jgi:hypothetical protein
MSISERRRIHHDLIRNPNEITGLSERNWSYVLQDENWHGPDPDECTVCGNAALYKWCGKGYCRAHHDQAKRACRVDSDALIGRYERAKRGGRLNFGRSMVHSALPKLALEEAIALDGIEELIAA